MSLDTADDVSLSSNEVCRDGEKEENKLNHGHPSSLALQEHLKVATTFKEQLWLFVDTPTSSRPVCAAYTRFTYASLVYVCRLLWTFL